MECEKCLINDKVGVIKEINNHYYCSDCISLLEENADYDKLAKEWKLYVERIKNRAKKTKYDILFAFSGGKDSVAALYLTIEKYNLKPLVFIIDHGFKSAQIKENLKTIIDHYKLDYIVSRVDETITDQIKTYAKNGELPCLHCNKLWKAPYFKKIVELTGIDIVFTGGDTLVDGKFEMEKPEWGASSVAFPLAIENFTEEQIYNIAYSLGWKNPSIKGWDTDCTAVGVALSNYRRKNGTYHVEELKHLAHRVRYGILEKEDARRKLLEPIVVGEELLDVD